jgi:hypothetical protein
VVDTTLNDGKVGGSRINKKDQTTYAIQGTPPPSINAMLIVIWGSIDSLVPIVLIIYISEHYHGGGILQLERGKTRVKIHKTSIPRAFYKQKAPQSSQSNL